MDYFFYSLGVAVGLGIIAYIVIFIERKFKAIKANKNGKEYIDKISSESEFDCIAIFNEMQNMDRKQRDNKRAELLGTGKFAIGYDTEYIYTTPFNSTNVEKSSVTGETILYIKKSFLFLVSPSCKYIKTINGKENHLEYVSRYDRYGKEPIITHYNIPLGNIISIYEDYVDGYHKLIYLVEGTNEDVIETLKKLGENLYDE